MNRKIVVLVLTTLALTSVHPAEAQQPKKVPLIGFLGGPSLASIKPLADAFRQGLRELVTLRDKVSLLSGDLLRE